MTGKQNNTKFQKLAEEAIEREIEKMEKVKGRLTENEKEIFRKHAYSKYLYLERLKHWVETEYVPGDPEWDADLYARAENSLKKENPKKFLKNEESLDK